MARALRIEFEDALYHVCARGNARGEIFKSDADRARFLALLEQSLPRFGGEVLCFVLMDNHFHLIVRTHCPNLSRWMQWLLVSYSVYFNRRHHRSGHLFQGRYKSFLVEGGEYLLALSRYIHLNRVRGVWIGRGTPAERRTRLRAFKWSSYRGYAGLTKSFPFIEEMTVLDELAGTTRAARLHYRRFVEEGLITEIDNPFEAVQWQTALGGERLLQQVRDRVKGLRHQRREMIAVRKAMELVQPEAVLNRVAMKFQINQERLKNPKAHGLKARNVAMWMMSENCGMTLRQIGELFGGLHYSAVAQRIRRARANYSEKSARALLAEMSNV